MASGRSIPRLWTVVQYSYGRYLGGVQEQCTEQGVLTDIAVKSQVAAQDESFRIAQEHAMILEDTRRFDENEGRYNADFAELMELESQQSAKFERVVKLTAMIMEKWGKLCAERDAAQVMCRQFHLTIAKVFDFSSLAGAAVGA